MSSTWSDSRVVSGTVAATAETQIGSDINIPANQTDQDHQIKNAVIELDRKRET